MDYRYLVETKNEFNNYLCGILVPHLYHGIKGMYKYSNNVYEQLELKKKKGGKITNPGLINIFKKTLGGISNLNSHEIEEEYNRIKSNSGCAEWFDNMIRASFKSFVLFLTWDPRTYNSKYSDNTIYDSIVIKDFIHKCYIVSCEYFVINPELFISRTDKKSIFEILKSCIESAMRKSLPYNQIIEEYLKIDFGSINDIGTKEIQNIKSMVYDMIGQQKYGQRPNLNNLIIESGIEEFVDLEQNSFDNKLELKNFIKEEKIKEFNKIGGKKLNDENELNTNSTNFESKTNSILLSRAEIKSKEIDEMIDGTNKSANESINESANESANESTNESTNKSANILANESSNTSTNTSTNELKTNLTTEQISESTKSNVNNILNSPPVFRQKKAEKNNDLFGISKKLNSKNNIKVVKSDKLSKAISDKFEAIDNYYENTLKK